MGSTRSLFLNILFFTPYRLKLQHGRPLADPVVESPLHGDLPGRRILERGLQHGVGA
jgi:hypothetical protein